VGGRAGGAAAADFALEGIAAYSCWPAFPSPKALGDLLRQIDLDASSHSEVGETTALGCAISERGSFGAAVGDSAVWWITESAVVSLSAGSGPKPWIGSGSAKPFTFAVPSEPGSLMLMTDGVWKYAHQTRLAELVRAADLNQVPASLINAAGLPSGSLQDDAAVIVARFRCLA
jgi:PPM family protein phosphatase